MAIESKRGCGYRKVGGLYIMGGGVLRRCGRLPLPLKVCQACGGGIKQTRGWTWIDPSKLFAGIPCESRPHECIDCPLGEITELSKAGLLWIGKSFYPTPRHFLQEANTMGVCRRIGAIPKGFELGKTWVFLAHPETMPGENEAGDSVMIAGVFRTFQPDRIEKVITETQSKDGEEMEKLKKRGITPFIVPDGDKDHQGTVYDKSEAAQPIDIPDFSE